MDGVSLFGRAGAVAWICEMPRVYPLATFGRPPVGALENDDVAVSPGSQMFDDDPVPG
jgi:hypothetical protein